MSFNKESYSIITPVYNRADSVGRCISSVIRNLHHQIDLEHIIVDDGSTDTTTTILQEYAQQYSHIKLIRFLDNRGTNAARNAAIREAKGNFCIILDSDDYLVDNAIMTIRKVMRKVPQYRHYLFVPNDMLVYYEKNSILKGCQERELSFADFLSNNINGDFVHVIDTQIMKRWPFDESLRIYEGVFFLRFYREEQHVLFTNELVTIRERSRTDSVTRETFRTSYQAIDRTIKATELNITWFEKDYEQLGLENILFCHYQSLIDNLLLLGRYSICKQYMNFLTKKGQNVPWQYKIIYMMRMGGVYRRVLKCYLTLKYKVLNKALQ